MFTCVQCGGGPFDKKEIMEMPNGPTCVGCYALLEKYVDELMEDDDLWP